MIQLLISLSLASAMSLDKSIPFKETLCQIGDKKATVYLRFDKKPDATENDFSGAPMIFIKGKNAQTIEPLRAKDPEDFNFVSVQESSNCKDTQAFKLNANSIAILYTHDNRPFQDIAHAVVFDFNADKILAKRELGALADSIETKDGFAFSTVIPRSDVDQVEMISTTGRKMHASDNDLSAFKTVTLKNGKLLIQYDPALSYEKSHWKKFFKSKDDFLKASGWDSKKKLFKNLVVYEATYFNRSESDILESCINFTTQRGAGFANSSWTCIKEKQ